MSSVHQLSVPEGLGADFRSLLSPETETEGFRPTLDRLSEERRFRRNPSIAETFRESGWTFSWDIRR